MKEKKKVYRVVLAYPNTVSHSVFVKARNREKAEARALRQHPDASGIDRTRFPLR